MHQRNNDKTPRLLNLAMFAASIVLPLALLLFAQAGRASTVLQIDTDALLDRAELVFEGSVIGSTAKWNADRSAIFTEVTFAISEVIKGSAPGQSLTLKFAGGEVDGTGMQVSSMHYPGPGERGIYFVESTSKVYTSPLVGWSQGHFLLERDAAGSDRVLTQRRMPVKAFAGGVLQRARGQQSQREAQYAPFSEGVARGVETGLQRGDHGDAMRADAFKQSLRALLRQAGHRQLPGSDPQGQ